MNSKQIVFNITPKTISLAVFAAVVCVIAAIITITGFPNKPTIAKALTPEPIAMCTNSTPPELNFTQTGYDVKFTFTIPARWMWGLDFGDNQHVDPIIFNDARNVTIQHKYNPGMVYLAKLLIHNPEKDCKYVVQAYLKFR